MARYLLLRLIGIVGVIWLIGTITFFLMHAIPGGPWDETKASLPPEVKANISRKYGLDRPLYAQYIGYWVNLVRGDLGIPYSSPTETVTSLIARSWPVSVQLGLYAIALAFLLGLPLGLVAALRQNSWIDHLATTVATFGLVTPNFVLAILLIWLFSRTLGWLPVGGWDSPKHMILPVITFALGPMAITARYTRTAVLEVLHSDYVRTARAKGLLNRTVVVRHILRNALIPMITVLAPMAGLLVTGSIFVESIFRVPGIGRFFSQSIFQRDYPLIMGLTLFYSLIVAVAFLITDLLYVAVDPRIDFEKSV
ncbi:MAG: ABC transporter permease [Caldilineaceae bacterium]|nr:ABC transporter permease [Caldilineaceae bacterium]